MRTHRARPAVDRVLLQLPCAVSPHLSIRTISRPPPRRCSAACLPGSATRRLCVFFASRWLPLDHAPCLCPVSCSDPVRVLYMLTYTPLTRKSALRSQNFCLQAHRQRDAGRAGSDHHEADHGHEMRALTLPQMASVPSLIVVPIPFLFLCRASSWRATTKGMTAIPGSETYSQDPSPATWMKTIW